MIHLRIVVPPDATELLTRLLRDDPRATNLVVLPGAALDPAGDLVICDVAREAASHVIAHLRDACLDERASIAIDDVDTLDSPVALRAERAAPGAPDDGIVWEQVLSRAWLDARNSWSFHVFLCLATLIAAVAVHTDSSILVVGAMVVGPEFGPVAAVAVGIVFGRAKLAGGAVRLLAAGFAVAIAVTAVVALAGSAAGWFDAADLEAPRPLTGFIWTPDRWSAVVAVLAGAAGVLSLTAGRTNALVGVFISVTTVPAAGNLALALALWVPEEMGGAAAQLGINLAGMTVAGCLVLALQRMLTTDRVRAARGRSRTLGSEGG